MNFDTNNHSVFMLHYPLIMWIKYHNKVIKDKRPNRLRELFAYIAPKYKSEKHSRRFYTTNNQNSTVTVTEKGIRLPKTGKVRAKIHRQPA